ncbi:MAG: UDP-glucose/GDP-mannose dehydrogenase family protein [Candidatus Nomurabacteria bacterium]|nr:MAG: UDP-glucose/GDP-mannose dehydrogenase family protein [Candidatus Nomurabacteria bacterium]
MKISVIGATGYVGLVSATCLAEIGHTVTCFGRNAEAINKLQRGNIPIYEPGLNELVKKNIKAKRLRFTTNFDLAVKESLAIFIAVGTPPLPNGKADLRAVFEVAQRIGQSMTDYKVIVDKSTVPVGTGQEVKHIIAKEYSGRFDVASCPEFLREGSAIEDFMHPDRVVIGTDSEKAKRVMLDIFKPQKTTKLTTNIESAELIKYASNAFLATKISFINEISNLCDLVRADVEEVARGMGLDKRIGQSFLKAGVGYGGSCFPKDVSALKELAGSSGYDFQLLKAVIEVNNTQRSVVIAKAKQLLGSLRNKHIGVLGLAFKQNTDDVRESAAIDIIKLLQKAGAKITAFDPVATEKAKSKLTRVKYAKSAKEACKQTDLLVIVTEWPEFAQLDWKKIRPTMRQAKIVDGRNLLDPIKMRELGYQYLSVGR